MKTIKIYNYNDELFDTGIPTSDFSKISKLLVEVISGDEVLTVFYKDGGVKSFDAADLSNEKRESDDFDNKYYITTKSEFNKWLMREESLDYAFN